MVKLIDHKSRRVSKRGGGQWPRGSEGREAAGRGAAPVKTGSIWAGIGRVILLCCGNKMYAFSFYFLTILL